MRTLIVTNIMSIDGYYEGPGGNVMALPMDDRFDEHNLERLRAADTLLLGGTTFRGFVSYWPSVAEDHSASDNNRAISRRNNEIDKLVVSDSLTQEETGAWRETTRIVGRADAPAAIAELKQQDGGDILMFGSRTTWHGLLAAGVVDELQLVVGGSVLGGGTPLFPAGTQAKLELLGTRSFDDSDNAILRYAVRQS
jgi:dihydrofolate reductase